MSLPLDWILLGILGLDFLLLGSLRFVNKVRYVALQGVLIGLFFLFTHEHPLRGFDYFTALFYMALKGGVFPRLLRATIRKVQIGSEGTPMISPMKSIIFGGLALGFSIWLSSRLPFSGKLAMSMITVSLFTIFSGLFLLVSRRKAVSQVMGYLTLENGIAVLGYTLVGEVPMIVELGILLDVFVAVFIMGIAVYRINREFDHMDVDQLNQLKG